MLVISPLLPMQAAICELYEVVDIHSQESVTVSDPFDLLQLHTTVRATVQTNYNV